jgi:hypothetical protein
MEVAMSLDNGNRLADFMVGDRVEMHPATDAWMMGDRYGEIVKIGRRVLHVRLDKSGRTRTVHPFNITGKV